MLHSVCLIPLARAYYHDEEPIYSKLACRFGMEDVKLEDATEVIVISDNTEEVKCGDLIVYDCGDKDEEVNSHVGLPPGVCAASSSMKTHWWRTGGRLQTQRLLSLTLHRTIHCVPYVTREKHFKNHLPLFRTSVVHQQGRRLAARVALILLGCGGLIYAGAREVATSDWEMKSY